MLASEQQQSSASILTLPQQQNQQAGTQTQSASSLDQPQNGLVQYQLTGNNPEPPTTDALGQYQPAGNNETPLAGDDLNSNVIVNAQLTHLISRDDAAQGQDAPNVPDVLMPDVPAVHDIATPRRTIGGRCRNWCVSAQPPTGKRKCAACCMCGTRFTHGEARLQQMGNRETNHHYVHAHCVNGGLGHDHELHPKLADDQEAVDAVTRQRDTITRTAADTEVLLPFAQDLDQASTAAPPDDERDLFGREEALRMDEEIMDFQWFEHVTWDSIKDLRGTTYVQPPTRFRFALQQAQHAILRAIIHNNPTSLASESAWKALVLSSWLLLGRPAVNASESNCAHFLDARLNLFFCLRIGLLSGPWYVPNVMLLRCRTRHAERTSSRCSHVFAKLLHWRVLVKKDEPWQLPETHHQFQSQNKLFKRSRASILLTQNHRLLCTAPVSALFLSEVAEHVPTTLRKMPRLSEPGPLGMRAEHWYDFGSLAGNSDLFVGKQLRT